MCKVSVVIPAYEPDVRLLELLKALDLNKIGPVYVINDGSDSSYDSIFESASEIIEKSGGKLLVHEKNQGKGRALKTAFSYILENDKETAGVVTADSDGQHTPECISKVIDALKKNTESLVLGVRCFDLDEVPWKSRFGNKMTEKTFKYITGVHITDTQTGLRGIPKAYMKELIDLKGERFEFEMRMLIDAAEKMKIIEVPIEDTQTGLRGIPKAYMKELIDLKGERFEFEMRMLIDAAEKMKIIEVPIETVYDSVDNHQTHFNPFKDSVRIYRILGWKFMKYIISSLSSSLLDIILFSIFCALLKAKYPVVYVTAATVIARVISATYNYLINYKLVFNSKENIGFSALKYFILAVVQMAFSAILVTLLVKALPYNLEILYKIIVDTVLFFVSYYIQQQVVFKRDKNR